jgi:signal peptidase
LKQTIQKIFLIIIIFILLFTLYSKFILKEELIKLYNTAILVVLTGSMEPTIKSGEMIIIKEQTDYNVDDIVTYKEDRNFFVTHRIINKYENKYETKGDNNNLIDETIDKDQIEGKVIYHSKVCGFFILYLLKPITLIVIIIFIVKEFFCHIYVKGEKNEK